MWSSFSPPRFFGLTQDSSRRTLRDRKPVQRRDRRARLSLESLEGRLVMSTLWVTKTSDSGAGSLRQAIISSNANTSSIPDIIDFNIPGSGPQTINLYADLPTINENVLITGPGANVLSVSGIGEYQVFIITANCTNVEISGLTIEYGWGPNDGGGIYNDGTLTVTDSTIADNSAFNDGGGIYNDGTLTATDSTIADNSAGDTLYTEGFGCGIYNGLSGPITGGTLTVTDSTIADNFAGVGGGVGGGIYNGAGLTVMVTDSTISGNNAAIGGGICTELSSSPSQPLIVSNTIIAGNTDWTASHTLGSGPDVNGGVNSQGNNLIGDPGRSSISGGWSSSDLLGTDSSPINPKLGPLVYNGGPTQTMALLPGSPAIDAGNNALAVDPTTGQPLATDQRGTGFPRIVQYHIDIGAYESSLAGNGYTVSDLSSTSNVFTVEVNLANSNYVAVYENSLPNPVIAGLPNIIGSITINNNLGAQDTVYVENNLGVPVTVNQGSGTDVVNVNPTNNNLDYIQGSVIVNGGSVLNVYDQGDPHTGSTYTMTGWYVYRPGAAYIYYNGINVVTVYGSPEPATYNVQGTEYGFTTNLILGGALHTAGSPATVNVGNNGSVQGILGTLNIDNPPNFNNITVNDSADTTQHPAITLSTFTSETFDGRYVPWGQIAGLAPAQINYVDDDTSSVTVQGGDCTLGNTWYVQATGFNYLGWYAGGPLGSVTTNIVAGGPDHVIVGNNNSVSAIQGTLNIENPPNFNNITVNDSADTTQHPAITLSTFTSETFDGRYVPWGQIAGLAPAQINYVDDDTSSVTVQGGDCTLGNTWYVQATGFNYLGWYAGGPLGSVTTNIVAGGPDHVIVGNNNSVSAIQGTLNIENSSNNSSIRNTININNSADATPRNVSLNYLATNPDAFEQDNDPWGQIIGLAPAAINFENDDTSVVNITSAPGSLTFIYVAPNEMSGVNPWVPVVNNNGKKVN